MKNIYKEELDAEATTEFFSVVQNEGGRNVSRKVKCFNLDAEYQYLQENVTGFIEDLGYETKILEDEERVLVLEKNAYYLIHS